MLQVASDVVFRGVVVADDLNLSIRLSHQLEQLLAVLPVPRLGKDPHADSKGVRPDEGALVDNVLDGHSNIGDCPGGKTV